VSAGKTQPSPPFADREFNGTVLVQEVEELLLAGVPAEQIWECGQDLQALLGVPASEASTKVQALAKTRTATHPMLVALLTRWAPRIRIQVDLPLFISHFNRLAMAMAALPALRAAAGRLPNGGRG
jgi:hypothetical protein